MIGAELAIIVDNVEEITEDWSMADDGLGY